MPPAISDDEQSDVSTDLRSSAKKAMRGKKAVAYKEEDPDNLDDEEVDGDGDVKITNGDVSDEQEDDEDEEQGEEEEEDVYVVEKITSHIIADDGEPKFKVKWEGYEKKEDQTWEYEDNLRTNASEALDEYLSSIGGRERLFEDTKKALKTKKRGRPSSSTPNGTTKRRRKSIDHPRDTTPPASAKAAEWKAPSGSWEDQVEAIDCCQDKDKGELVIFLTWKNGQKTQHKKEVVYRRCPQKMLHFFEQRIRITDDTEPISKKESKDD